MFKKLDDILFEAQGREVVKMVVVAAHDIQVLESIRMAVDHQLVEPILIGRKHEILQLSEKIGFNVSGFEIKDSFNEVDASQLAISCLEENRASIIMKGFLPTNIFLKAIIDHEKLIDNQMIMSHVAIVQVMGYHKLLAISDVAMNVYPDLVSKKAIIENAINVAHKLKIDLPKVALLAPFEKVNPKINSTLDAQSIVEQYKNGEFTRCFIEGPLALDNAVSRESAFKKGINGIVAGDADILICNDLDSGNILYKSLVFLAGAQTAAIVTGASVPVVLTSRSDDALNKLYSIALAKIMV